MSNGRILNEDAWGFMNALFATKDATTIHSVQNLWTTALGPQAIFPLDPTPASPRTSFTFSVKEALTTNNEHDATIVELLVAAPASQAVTKAALDEESIKTRQVLVVSCKSALKDTPAGWTCAEEQLGQYLEEKMNHCERVYAAVAIGTKVVFFRRDRSQGGAGQMTQIHSGALDFQVPAHRRLIEGHFEEINNHGKAWAESLW
ncbi:hypothetical protein IMZ48_39315 [Candidatus Bathyarchaeota archaeon]|nr:hypothetical protein [Candidatus Bathyarchaeota archaeon]